MPSLGGLIHDTVQPGTLQLVDAVAFGIPQRPVAENELDATESLRVWDDGVGRDDTATTPLIGTLTRTEQIANLLGGRITGERSGHARF